MNVNDLTDSILRHAVELQALSANEEARAERILRELEGELRALLNSRTLSEAGRRQIDALIREAHDAISQRYINIAGVVDVGAIVEHVADRTVQFMRDTYPAETFTLPPTQVLKSLSRDILIEGSPASAWWDKQAEDTAFRFAGIVRNGVVNNETNEQIVRRVAGGRGEPGLLDVSRRNVRALVHSSIMTAANRARMETYKAAFGDTSDGVRWLATLDSHTCQRCAALDGQSWDWEGNKLNGTKADFHVAPLHVNCFPGDTLVAPGGWVTGVSERWYDGEVVFIKTASGRELTCTPNHPILTDHGWVAAGLLDIGCNVVCNRRGEWGRLGDGYGENAPALIHDVAKSFLRSREVAPTPVKVSAEDFHGDGVGSDVAIVWADSLLRRALDTALVQPDSEPALVAGTSAGLVDLSGGGPGAEFVETGAASSSGDVCGSDLFAALFCRHCSPFQGLGLGAAAAGDTVFTEDSGHDYPLYGELLGDGIFRYAGGIGGADSGLINDGAGADWYASALEHAQNDGVRDASLVADLTGIEPGDIEIDAVVDLGFRIFSGQVYNLETSSGWYIAQGVVVHNCRCVMTPLPPDFDELFGPGFNDKFARIGARASSQGPQASGTTFSDFLKRQSPEWVEEWMGVKRAEMYRQGKLTLTDLITKSGRQKTLEEL